MPHTIVSGPSSAISTAPRPVWPAVRRGWACRCPACGEGRMFGRYLKVEPVCSRCGTELHHHRADDAPPYFTMFIVGHVIIGALLALEKKFAPETWVHLVIWLPLTLVLTLWMLPRVKGTLVAYQWALRMHGFGAGPDPAEPEAWPPTAGRKAP